MTKELFRQEAMEQCCHKLRGQDFRPAKFAQTFIANTLLLNVVVVKLITTIEFDGNAL